VSEVVYKVRRLLPGGQAVFHDTVGYQIGRFAIRDRTPADMNGITDKGDRVPLKKFLIDHVNTGIIVIDSDDWDEAVRLADDISRFCTRDPSTKDPSKFVGQLDPKMVEWIIWMIRNKQRVSYRQHHKIPEQTLDT
jgi:hypothetical protein